MLNTPKPLKIKNFAALVISGLINAFGVTIFLYPVKLYDSGISGTSMLLAQLTPDYLSLSIFLLILNLPLFIFGYRRLGRNFTVYSIFAVTVYSIGAWLITDVLPVDVSMASPLAGSDLLLCAIFGGIISGIGSGATIRFGGAIDGIEVLAVIFAKKLGMTVGTFVMIYNSILYIICGIILQSWILPLYSIVTYASALKAVDFIVEGVDRSKAATIITTKPDEICETLSEYFKTGMTRIQAKGGFSGEDKMMIYIVLNRFQIIRMKSIVHEIDPYAYIAISEIADIYKSEKRSSDSTKEIQNKSTKQLPKVNEDSVNSSALEIIQDTSNVTDELVVNSSPEEAQESPESVESPQSIVQPNG